MKVKRIFGEKVYRYASLPSTMEKAGELAERGEPEGTVLIAESQSKGRGRWGRRWFSPEGGLYFSLILRPGEKKLVKSIPILAGLSLKRAIKKVTGLASWMKLPNDILINKKKVAGILLEKKNSFLILGIGINTNIKEEELTEFSATSLSRLTGKRIDNKKLLETFLQDFEESYFVDNFRGKD